MIQHTSFERYAALSRISVLLEELRALKVTVGSASTNLNELPDDELLEALASAGRS